ncbi:MAG: hypothetical protein ACI80S_000180, partial [Pseudohongiellaceae bacterium]
TLSFRQEVKSEHGTHCTIFLPSEEKIRTGRHRL